MDVNGNMCFVPSKSLIPSAVLMPNNLTKINGANGQLLSSVALPIVLQNKIMKFEIDSLSNYYFVIETEEENLGTAGAFRPNKITAGTYPNKQYVLLKYNTNMQLQYATYLPFVLGTNFPKIILRNNKVYIGGVTYEANLGTVGVFQTDKIGFSNAYLLELNNTNGALDWFTYAGGENVSGLSVTGDFQNEVYMSFVTTATENVVTENGILSDSNIFEPLENGYRTVLVKLVQSNGASTENFLKGKVNVYPNPVNDVLAVELSEELSGNQLFYELYDVSGKLVGSQVLTAKHNNINVSNYASGVYLLKVYDTETNAAQHFKIVKE